MYVRSSLIIVKWLYIKSVDSFLHAMVDRVLAEIANVMSCLSTLVFLLSQHPKKKRREPKKEKTDKIFTFVLYASSASSISLSPSLATSGSGRFVIA